MKVLLAASEVSPIIKLGGLGDVVGSLPKALEKLNVDVDIIVPFFPVAKTQNLKVYKSLNMDVPFNGQEILVEVYKTKLPNSDVDVFLLKNAQFFSMGGKNAFANSVSETEMFSFFDRAVVEFVKSKFNTYDVIHCNDWHTGFITHLLEEELHAGRPATVLTIHNLSYQGVSSPDIVRELGIYPGENSVINWDLADGDINLMQEGLASADFITTVSPTYAKEILTPELGAGMSDILSARSGRVVGILNGLDYDQFPRDFSTQSWYEAKAKKRKYIQEKLGLQNSNKPMFSFISRLDPNQKGLDILHNVIPDIIRQGGQFVLLGTGNPEWEKRFAEMNDVPEFRGNISVKIAFDVNLANDIYTASNFFFVPSKFEPCGLTQMIAMWYGAIPIAHATGGLADTVIEKSTGFVFKDYSAEDFSAAIKRAFDLYSKQDVYSSMVGKIMTQDFGWQNSAKLYLDVYKKAYLLREKSLNLQNDVSIFTSSNGN